MSSNTFDRISSFDGLRLFDFRELFFHPFV
jgi:hypothetical protein